MALNPSNTGPIVPPKDAGILTREDIIAEIAAGRLMVNGTPDNAEPASYDLTIGTIFRDGQVIEASHPSAGTPVLLEPGEVISMYTKERLNLGNDIAGTVYARNGQSSKGLLVLNPGHIDPGFKGRVTVRAINLRKTKLPITLNDKIFTIVFERLPKPTARGYPDPSQTEDAETRSFNEQDLQVSPENLAKLVTLAPHAPYLTAQEVDEKIRNAPYLSAEEVDRKIRSNWATVLVFIFTAVAAVTGIAAVYLAVRDTNKKEVPTESRPNGATLPAVVISGPAGRKDTHVLPPTPGPPGKGTGN